MRATLLLAILALAGCKSDPTPAPTSGSSTAASATTPAPTPTPAPQVPAAAPAPAPQAAPASAPAPAPTPAPAATPDELAAQHRRLDHYDEVIAHAKQSLAEATTEPQKRKAQRLLDATQARRDALAQQLTAAPR